MQAEYRIVYDREKLALYGLNTATVSTFVRNRINGLVASKYREEGDEYEIVVRYAEEFRSSITDIENIRLGRTDDTLERRGRGRQLWFHNRSEQRLQRK